MAVIVVPAGMCTFTGVALKWVVPSPSCPRVLTPQAHTWPVLVKATLWKQPARTDVTLMPAGSLTLTGTVLVCVGSVAELTIVAESPGAQRSADGRGRCSTGTAGYVAGCRRGTRGQCRDGQRGRRGDAARRRAPDYQPPPAHRLPAPNRLISHLMLPSLFICYLAACDAGCGRVTSGTTGRSAPDAADRSRSPAGVARFCREVLARR